MDMFFKRNNNGHGTALLSFKEQRPTLLNKKFLALKRAHSQDVSLTKNPTQLDYVVTLMKGVIDRGAAVVPLPILEDKECWYLPLFVVYLPKTPGKSRAIFSLN